MPNAGRAGGRDAGLAFDLISDLHEDQWGDRPPRIDRAAWRTAPTLICAGDICADPRRAVARLRDFARIWDRVLFVDGNHEGGRAWRDMDRAPRELGRMIGRLPNVHYLRDEVPILDGVAIVGANGWWRFDMVETTPEEKARARRRVAAKAGADEGLCNDIVRRADLDLRALESRVRDLQDRDEARRILVVTHSVPDPALLDWSWLPDGARERQLSTGCRDMARRLRAADSRGKIAGWIFGHQHTPRDQALAGRRYLSHPCGTPTDRNAIGAAAYRPRPLAVRPGLGLIDRPAAPPAAAPRQPTPDGPPRPRAPGF